jgi:Zn-dependent protease
MKWSWRIGRVAGIEVRVHATFVLLLVWAAVVYHREFGTTLGAAQGVLFTLALFVSVVLHEFGHALAARRFGVPTKDITLLPIGGVARLETIPDVPKQELAIALAGPAVTLAISLVLFAALLIAGAPVPRPDALLANAGAGAWVARLMWVNLWLLVFNLLPAFPMDGGRVLRAALALRLDALRATEIAAGVGRAFALLFGLVGLLYNPFLVLIALFVWIGAAGESAALHQRTLLSGVPVERVMIHDVRTLAPGDTLGTALDHVLAGFQHDFPVVDNGAVSGVLTRAGLLAALAHRGPDSPVAQAMDTSFRTADAREPAERALARLRECKCQTLPVLSGGHLSGVVTLENVAEFVMIQDALRAAAAERAAH